MRFPGANGFLQCEVQQKPCSRSHLYIGRHALLQPFRARRLVPGRIGTVTDSPGEREFRGHSS